MGAAEWLTRGAGEFGTFHSMVPDVFEAYGRVFHPAELDDREVRWSEVAIANGRTMHGAAEWGQLTGSWDLEGQDCLWDREPEKGELPEHTALRLAEILRRHTRTQERCWFAVWEGWGETHLMLMFRQGTPLEEQARIKEEREAEIRTWESLVRGAPVCVMPSRAYHLLTGPLSELGRFYGAGHRHPPSIWWPEDRAWCVGGDVDLMSTYLGGAADTVEAVVSAPELEALAIPAAQDVTVEADTINPPAGEPRA